MPPPLIGDWTVQIQSVRPFTIHGDLYYELHVLETDDSAQMRAVRVPQHAIIGEPQPGERVVISFLMGQVTAAKRVG
jgi:hypothetical protein